MIKLKVVAVGNYAFEGTYLGLEVTGNFEVDWDGDIALPHVVEIIVKSLEGEYLVLPLEHIDMDALEESIQNDFDQYGDWLINRQVEAQDLDWDMER